MYGSILLSAPSRRRRRPFSYLAKLAVASLAVTLPVIGAGTQGATAQQVANPWQPKLLVTPYLWLSGIYGTIETPIA
jgi:hypothetical protein